jgi:hypothetical protein
MRNAFRANTGAATATLMLEFQDSYVPIADKHVKRQAVHFCG